MKRLLLTAAAVSVLAAVPAHAQEPDPPREPARPDGYVFEDSRLLTQQLLWGLVHGVRLLANTCRGDEADAALALAYADWVDRYRPRIAAAARDLALHYYGSEPMPLDAVSFALHLKPALDLPPEELAAACASFTTALKSPRYDLDLFFDLRRDAARLERAAAVRARVAKCRPPMEGEAGAALDGAFEAWLAANGPLEVVARSRMLESLGDTPEDRKWRAEAGAGAVPAPVACADLAAALAQPSHALSEVFQDPKP